MVSSAFLVIFQPTSCESTSVIRQRPIEMTDGSVIGSEAKIVSDIPVCLTTLLLKHGSVGEEAHGAALGFVALRICGLETHSNKLVRAMMGRDRDGNGGCKLAKWRSVTTHHRPGTH